MVGLALFISVLCCWYYCFVGYYFVSVVIWLLQRSFNSHKHTHAHTQALFLLALKYRYNNSMQYVLVWVEFFRFPFCCRLVGLSDEITLTIQVVNTVTMTQTIWQQHSRKRAHTSIEIMGVWAREREKNNKTLRLCSTHINRNIIISDVVVVVVLGCEKQEEKNIEILRVNAHKHTHSIALKF